MPIEAPGSAPGAPLSSEDGSAPGDRGPRDTGDRSAPQPTVASVNGHDTARVGLVLVALTPCHLVMDAIGSSSRGGSRGILPGLPAAVC
jgi:hypothetical protein